MDIENTFEVNRGINRPTEFKGLKAQYILYLVAGLLALLVLFAVLYLIGLSVFLILPLTGGLGAGLFVSVNKYNKKYGVHGLMKTAAHRKLPKALRGCRFALDGKNIIHTKN